jgi:dTDP-4-dehydrorhamnose reductase
VRVVITGAGGMVGRATVAHCLSAGDHVTALTHGELDISDRDAAIASIQPGAVDSVINCAAWTDVDGCETDRERNYAVNARGVENLAVACRLAGANLVTISTDYVFDGSKEGFYTQQDVPDPQSEYGKAKLEGERLAMAALDRATVVRAGWIFGDGGTNFLSKLPDILRRGEPVSAIGDAFGTPTFAPDLARRLRELAMLDEPNIYHVANEGEGTSYAGFARRVAQSIGVGCIIEISASELQRPAPRPANSRLRCLFSASVGLLPLRSWEAALDEFVSA